MPNNFDEQNIEPIDQQPLDIETVDSVDVESEILDQEVLSSEVDKGSDIFLNTDKKFINTVYPMVAYAATDIIKPEAGIINVSATVGGGAVTLTSNPSIADGINGQSLILRGTSDTDTLGLTNGNGMRMVADIILGLNDTISFYYDGVVTNDWIEVSRNIDTTTATTLGTFTAYENIGADDAVCLVAADTTDQTYSESNQDADLAIGDDAARTYVAQGFKPGATTYINKVDLYLKKNGSPGGNLTVHIYSDNGVAAPNVSLGSGTIAGPDVTTSYQYLTVSFADPIYVVASTQYYIVITRTDAVNAANYFIVGVDNSSASYGTANEDTRFVGDATPTWTETVTSDLIFKTYKEDTTAAARIRPTKASSAIRTHTFIGFAGSAITAGSSGLVTRFPSMTALASITPGRPVYLSNTAGAVSTTAGTFVLQVAVGKTTTSVEITSNQPPIGVPGWVEIEAKNWSSSATTQTIYIPTAYDMVMLFFNITAGLPTITCRVNGSADAGYDYIFIDNDGTPTLSQTTGATSWQLVGSIATTENAFGMFLISGTDSGGAFTIASMGNSLGGVGADDFLLSGTTSASSGILTSVNLLFSAVCTGKARLYGINL